MSDESDIALNFPAALVLRWAFKAFLLGWFLGAAAAISALLTQ